MLGRAAASVATKSISISSKQPLQCSPIGVVVHRTLNVEQGSTTSSAFSSSSTSTSSSLGLTETRRGSLGVVTETQPLVIYDGVCNFCNASVNFLLSRDSHSVFKFTHWQSPLGQVFLSNYQHTYPKPIEFNSTIVLIEGNQIYIESDAALMISRRLSPSWVFKPISYVGWLLPSIIRDSAYKFIAKVRYSIFGKTDTCRIPSSAEKKRFLL
jgi:predicted DCC family thiol-disulfide oxidoreductase YuxK